MRHRNWKRRFGSILLGTAMCAGALPAVPVLAQEEMPLQDAASSSTQMVSDPELVIDNIVSADTEERSINFNENWKFSLSDPSGAEQSSYDDSRWEQVNLPHDYSLSQDYSSAGEAESGYKLGGVGWYRKSFTLDESVKNKRVVIQFNGVYMDTTVYLNGHQLGNHPYGYTGFAFDLTDYLNEDGPNVLSVRVNHQTPSSRWYSGSGIYRDVYLTVTDSVSVDYNGVFVSTPDLATNQTNPTTKTETTVRNTSNADASVSVRQTVMDGDNALASVTSNASTIAAGASSKIEASMNVANPELWSVKTNTPKLYTLKTEVLVNDVVTDTVETTFGYRYFGFDRDEGFSLNGEKMKLKGVCLHHDQGALGSEANDRAIERQIEKLKEMGCNAIRVTHNPADPDLLKAADEHGMLIINELFDGWTGAKNSNSNDYARFFSRSIDASNALLNKEDGDTWAEFDTRMAVQTSRNNASVIMYSLCNEVSEGAYEFANQTTIASNMIGWINESDPTRKATIGDNNLKKYSSWSIALSRTIADLGGIIGMNYTNASQYASLRNQNSNWIIYGAETASSVNARGIYNPANGSQPSNKMLTSYDRSKVGWGHYAAEAWYDTIRLDYNAGEFVWTGFDYLGEPTPWNGVGSGYASGEGSPKSSYFGIIDTAGLEKDSYYLYQSFWNEDVNTLHVLPAWNSNVVANPNGQNDVVVYSDAASVELFFTPTGGTETSLGKKTFTKKTTAGGYTYQIYEGSDKSSTAYENLYLTWKVPYADGTLRAVGYDENNQIISNTEGRNVVKTTGAASKLTAEADRKTIEADGSDLSYIRIDVRDEDGNIVPDAENRVQVSVEGAGTLAGLDNGKQTDWQSYQDDNRKAHAGSLVAIVRSDGTEGDIRVTITSSNLETATVNLKAEGNARPASSGLLYSRNYYVKVGTIPVLPETIVSVDADGNESEKSVTWNSISADDVAAVGSFSVTGTCDGKSVSVIVNVMEMPKVMLNTSTAVRPGAVPALPDSLKGVMADGSLTDVLIPVVWDEMTSDQFASAGTVVVNGTATLFGTDYPVSASVRVTQGEVTLGDPMTGARYAQSIPEDSQSDTLSAIGDGNVAYDPNSKDSNNNNLTCWSNYGYSYETPENNTAYVELRYDTQATIGKATVYFVSDSWSVTCPDAGTTYIEYTDNLDDETSWKRINTTETIGDFIGSGSVGYQPYTYEFVDGPVTGTYFRVHVTNAEGQKEGNNHNKTTGISEVQLFKSETTFNLSSSSALKGMTIDGNAVSMDALNEGVINTESLDPELSFTSDNAGITLLQISDYKMLILSQSEDGRTLTRYTLNLGVVDATDSSRDIPVDRLTAQAGSEQSGNPGSLVLDGNTNTHWHTAWDPKCSNDDLWMILKSANGETMKVDGLRYLPRTDLINGLIYTYRIDALGADGETWTTVAEGDFARNQDWHIVRFKEVETTAIRIFAVDSHKDNAGRHATAAEMRLTGSVNEPSALDYKLLDLILGTKSDVEAGNFKSTDAYMSAWNAANAVRSNATTQSEVNEAARTLNNALLELRLTPSKELVDGLK